MKIGILTDFDGTIASSDASYAILERYADKFWYEIEERAYAHEITILDAIKEQTKLIKCSPEDAREYLLEKIKIRPGFREFAEFCRDKDIPLEICSDGFGWTIEVLLKHWDLDWIPWTSNKTIPSADGWDVEFQHHREGCPINANCKCSHLWRMQEIADKVIFIGDGTTDECVSKEANVVYARDQLLELCEKNDVDCIPWTEWKEISDHIEKLI